MKPELPFLLALTYIPGIGPINQRKILSLIQAEDLWSLSEHEIKNIFKNRGDLVGHFRSKKCLEKAYSEITFCKDNNIEILTLEDANYPKSLKNCSDAPLILFQKGNYSFQKKLHVGIVGTRKMTAYGKKFIENLIKDLSNQDIAIVSGLAFGCDIQAHRSCIEQQMTNVAVLAHGLNRVSPVGHKKEAHEIINNGALLSEYSSFHQAEAINFVLRNRIIAGICDAVIVVESDKRGGALATANYANGYNREVFAVPGRLEDKFSLGCNQLIQNNQAYMIRNAQDLLDHYQLTKKTPAKPMDLFVVLTDEEQIIYDFLKKNGRQQIDTLAVSLNMSMHLLHVGLLNLELKGIVRPVSGKFYELH